MIAKTNKYYINFELTIKNQFVDHNIQMETDDLSAKCIIASRFCAHSTININSPVCSCKRVCAKRIEITPNRAIPLQHI